MTRAGNVELAWESRAGRRVEVEFFPDRLQYFLDSDGRENEGEMELSRLPELIATLDREDAAEP
jgi:hypothetical protein